MFKCFDNTKLQNEILKCDQCNVPFNAYDQPRSLPCGDTICSACVAKIEREATNQKFKCSICKRDHYIPEEGLALNKKICALITAEPMEISRGENYERLQNNLKNIKMISQLLWSDYENGVDIIKEYFNEQIRLIQLSTENKIEQINKLSDELIAFIREYEKDCIQSYLNKHESTKVNMKKIIKETESFLNEKQAYLQQYKIDDEEIKLFNKSSEDLQLTLKSIKLKSLIFDSKLIKFLSNAKNISKSELGIFHYEYLRDPTKLFSGSSDTTIKFWELDSGKCIKTFLGHADTVLCVKNVLDNILISGDYTGKIKVWKIETGECLKTINAHGKAIYGIELITNDQFVTCSDDKTIKMFDLNTYECIRTYIGHEDQVCCIDTKLNGRIVSCSKDKTIRIWDLNSDECLKILRGHTKEVSSIRVISDEKINSGSDYEIKVWDVESGTCLQTFNVGNTHFIRSIVQISNEKMASCDQDGKIIIWKIDNGECLKTIEAHSKTIWRLVKLSDTKIISCSSDKTIKVWDIETGVCLKTLEAHNSEVCGLELFN